MVEYIEKNNLPRKAFISEDATAIIPKREFHSRYNKVLGFSSPLGENGLPDPSVGIVNSARDIVHIFEKYSAAKVVFVVMAQPLADFAPPIRICTFASDNKMTAADVKRRHDFINKCLKEAGIERLATGSDGDTREMKFMLQHIGIGMQLSDLNFSKESDEYQFFKKCPGFACNVLDTDFVVQDVPHILTKLRTKLLKNDLIPLGNYVATSNDLQALFEQRSKDKLVIRKGIKNKIISYSLDDSYLNWYERFPAGDLTLIDKMNVDAALRLCDPRVRQLLDDVWKVI